jgi:hypothetical protein
MFGANCLRLLVAQHRVVVQEAEEDQVKQSSMQNRKQKSWRNKK